MQERIKHLPNASFIIKLLHSNQEFSTLSLPWIQLKDKLSKTVIKFVGCWVTFGAKLSNMPSDLQITSFTQTVSRFYALYELRVGV